MKPYTEPAKVRAVLHHAQTHGKESAAQTYGIAPIVIRRWIEARTKHGPDWPTIEMQQEWEARQQTRAHTRALKARYRIQRITTGPTWVDATGTRRRLQALARIGWPPSSLEPHIGRASSTIGDWYRREKVHRDTAALVTHAYEQLSMTPGPSQRAAALAAARDWPPPLAWDEGTIDNPAATPRGTLNHKPKRRDPNEIDPVNVERLLLLERVKGSTRAEKEAAMARWVAAGGSINALCDAHGWQQGRYVDRKQDAA